MTKSIAVVRSIGCILVAMYKIKKKYEKQEREKEKIVVVPMSYIPMGQKD